MRKKYKNKRRSCALCKPWKRGWMKRWKYKEETDIKEFEKTKKIIN